MKATEQYFPAVLFIMLYKMVLTFQPVNIILKWFMLFCFVRASKTDTTGNTVGEVFRKWKHDRRKGVIHVPHHG